MKLYEAIDLHSNNNVTVLIDDKIKLSIRNACPTICH
jgi:hypothetical protein